MQNPVSTEPTLNETLGNFENVALGSLRDVIGVAFALRDVTFEIVGNVGATERAKASVDEEYARLTCESLTTVIVDAAAAARALRGSAKWESSDPRMQDLCLSLLSLASSCARLHVSAEGLRELAPPTACLIAEAAEHTTTILEAIAPIVDLRL